MSIAVSQLCIERGSRVLASDVTFTAAPGDVVGLIGPNGCGKSTLLAVLAGQLPATTGTVSLPPGASVGLMDQGRSAPEGATVLEWIHWRTGVTAATRQLDAATARLAAGDLSPAAVDDYDRTLTTWLARGAADIDERFLQAAADIGLCTPPDRSASSLSGGEAARVALAGILVSRYDALLLDEPTNDLDESGLEWLREFIQGAQVPVILVSHDRDFLAETVTSVLEFDPVLQRTSCYRGGFDAWQAERRAAHAAARDNYTRYAEQRDQLRERARAARATAQRGTAAARRKYASGRADKLTRSAMVEGATSGGQTAGRMEREAQRLEPVEQPRKQWQLRLSFPTFPDSPTVLATADGAITRAGDFTLGPITTAVHGSDRILVTGANGAGKSLLISLLLGRPAPDDGRVTPFAAKRVGVIDQGRSLPQTRTAFAAAAQSLPDLEPVAIRTHLAKFGLDAEDLARAPEFLSCGERTRLQLALAAARSTAALVLDEPTNHIDLPAIEQLEQALDDYPGAIVLVTHDRRLRRAFRATRQWRLDRGRLFEDLDTST